MHPVRPLAQPRRDVRRGPHPGRSRPAHPLLLALALLLPQVGSAQERGIQPEDYYRMTFVSDVALSPAGDAVAFTVTTVSEEDNERNRRIWLVELEDGEPVAEPVPLTDPTRDSSGPRWSPDGRLLAFQSRRDDEGGPWFLRMDRVGGEAFRIPGVEGTPLWSPNGEWIAFTTRPDREKDEERDRAPSEERGWIAPDAITETADPRRFDGRVITHARYKSDGTHPLLPHPDAQARTQLHVVAADGGEARQITAMDFDVGQVAWSPDGERLAFAGNELQIEDPYARRSDLYLVAREGGEARRLTPGQGVSRAPAFSPSGDRLAFLVTPEPGAETDLMVADLGEDGTFQGEPRNLTAGWDLVPGSPTWTRDARALRFETSAFGNRHLYEVTVEPAADADGSSAGAGSGVPEVMRITEGDRQLSGFSDARNRELIAYVSTDVTRPGEVHVARADGSEERRITAFNDDWLAEVALEAAERITWQVGDGTEVEGWVIPPLGHREGESRPMVLKIHGGPHSMYGNTFFQTFHVLSAAGFYVFYPNPRGSSGYGHDFMYATRGEWGLVDEEDFLTGLDAVLERYPDIDPERLGVSGGSYGGYATNWLTARSDRFAAAVTSRSIVSLETLHGTSDAMGTLEFEFFGTPWEERERYRAASPYSFVENVTAPTLIIHSEYDHRTPMQDADMWFRALEIQGVPVEFVRYPRSSHGLSRTGEPWLLVDRLVRIRSWFDHWLGG